MKRRALTISAIVLLACLAVLTIWLSADSERRADALPSQSSHIEPDHGRAAGSGSKEALSSGTAVAGVPSLAQHDLSAAEFEKVTSFLSTFREELKRLQGDVTFELTNENGQTRAKHVIEPEIDQYTNASQQLSSLLMQFEPQSRAGKAARLEGEKILRSFKPSIVVYDAAVSSTSPGGRTLDIYLAPPATK